MVVVNFKSVRGFFLNGAVVPEKLHNRVGRIMRKSPLDHAKGFLGEGFEDVDVVRQPFEKIIGEFVAVVPRDLYGRGF